MPRTTSYQKAQAELDGLGLVVTPQVILDRQGAPDSHRLWVYNPEAVTAVAATKWPHAEVEHGCTIGMVLVFDQDEKFVGANYSNLFYGDWDPEGWEARTLVSAWSPDERTLKAAVSFLRGYSPVGTTQARLVAQEAAQAAEKAEQERQANLAALNQAVLDNVDGKAWASSVAYTAASERRRLVSELRDIAKRATESAEKLEAGGRAGSLWFHPGAVLTIVERIAKLEALEETLEGPLAEAIKAMQERYDY